MILITIVLAIYIGYTWTLSLSKKTIFGSLAMAGLLWATFFPLATWLKIDPELLFLCSVSIGALGYAFTHGFTPFWVHCLLLLLIAALGTHWHLTDFQSTLKLSLLALVVGNNVIRWPLRILPNVKEKFTVQNQIGEVLLLGVIATINIFISYFLYWGKS